MDDYNLTDSKTSFYDIQAMLKAPPEIEKLNSLCAVIGSEVNVLSSYAQEGIERKKTTDVQFLIAS